MPLPLKLHSSRAFDDVTYLASSNTSLVNHQPSSHCFYPSTIIDLAFNTI